MLRPPSREEGLVPVVVFPNRGEGYGWQIGVQEGIPNGYLGTIDGIVHDGLVFSPALSFIETGLGINNAPPAFPGFIIQWGSTLLWSELSLVAGTPLVHRGAVRQVSTSLEGTPSQSVAVDGVLFTSAALHFVGTATYLFTGERSVETLAVGTLRRRDSAGAWTQGPINAAVVASIAGALWAADDSSVRKCPPGSDPTVLANWGPPIYVGNQGKIKQIVSVGNRLVIMASDGVYTYDDSTGLFTNEYPVLANDLNFPFAVGDGAGGVVTGLVTGEIIHLKPFGQILTYDPLRNKPSYALQRPMPVTAAVVGNRIYVATENSNREFAGTGPLDANNPFYVWITVNGVPTSSINNTHDGNSATGDPITLATGEYLYLGYRDAPIWAVQFKLAAGYTSTSGTKNTTIATLQVERSDGQGGWTPPVNALHTTRGSYPTAFSAPFFHDGDVYSFSATEHSQNTPLRWGKGTVRDQTAYWLRLSASASLQTVAIAEMILLPAVPHEPGARKLPGDIWELQPKLCPVWPRVLVGTIRPDGIVWDHDVRIPAAEGPSPRVLFATSLESDRRLDGNLALSASVKRYGRPLAPSTPLAFPSAVVASQAWLLPSTVIMDGTYELAYAELWGAGKGKVQFSYQMDDQQWSQPLEGNIEYALLPVAPGSAQGTAVSAMIGVLPDTTVSTYPPRIYRAVLWLRPIRTTPPVVR